MNLVNSVSATKNNEILNELIEIANTYPENTGFVPCVHKGTQKPPCKSATNWQKGKITANKIIGFERDNIKCLGLLLQDDYIAFDCDGKSAISKLNDLAFTYGLPETLQISSNPGTRQAYIFKINKKVKYQSIQTASGTGFNSSDKEQLEFRSGLHYQIIAGLHPSGKLYLTNNADILDLPEKWYDYLNNTLDEFVPQDSLQFQLHTLLERLRLKDSFFGQDYETWLKIGMICHHTIDDTDKALELWSIWSRKFPGFEETDQDTYDKKWVSFSKDLGNGITIGSLYHYLYEKKPDLFQDSEISNNLKEVDQLVEQGVLLLIEKECVQYKNAALTSDELPLFAAKISQKILGSTNKQYIDYVTSYLSSEVVTIDDISIAHESVKSLIDAEKSTLNVDYILEGTSIKEPLSDYARFYKMPKEYLLLAQLTAFSACLSKKISYNFNLDSNVSSSLFTLFIGDAASGKSEIVKPFVKPLEMLANERNNAHIEALQEYESKLADWKALKKQERHEIYLQKTCKYEMDDNVTTAEMREAVVPTPKEKNPILVPDASFEMLKKMSGQFKDTALLIAPDEIIDFLDTISQITKQNDSLSKLIPVWNNSTTLRRRITGEHEQADFFQVSLLSGVQTKRFTKYFDLNDESGILSRFLMLPIENINIPVGMNPGNDLNLLSEISHKIFRDTQETLNFNNKIVVQHTQEVLDLWGSWKNIQDAKAETVKNINDGFEKWLRRNPLYTARIALVIHCLRFVESQESNLSVMSIQSMNRAIAISKYLTDKAQIVFNQALTDNTIEQNNELNKIFIDLLKICKNEIRKMSFFTNNSLMRRKDVLLKYGKKGSLYLVKSEILKLLKDAEKYKIGVFDAKQNTFTPNDSFK